MIKTLIRAKHGAIIFLFIFAIVFSQYFFDINKTREVTPSSLILPAEIFKAVDLGLHSAFASLAWLSIVQNVMTPRANLLDQDLLLVTKLDPRFSYPYAFGVLFLPTLKKPYAAIKLGELGIKNAEPNWEIPYYMAVVYHENFHDSVNAEKYFIRSAETPGASATAKYLAVSYGTQHSRRKQTKAIWKGIYDTSHDEIVRDRARSYLEQIDIIDMLETSATVYKKKIGRYPEHIDDLIVKKILKEAPQAPPGYSYYFDTNGQVKIKIQ